MRVKTITINGRQYDVKIIPAGMSGGKILTRKEERIERRRKRDESRKWKKKLNDVLKRFWEQHPITQTEKIALLKTYSTIVIRKVSKEIRLKERKKFSKSRKLINRLVYNPDCVCFACGGIPELRHHIIMLLNGGLNWKQNLVGLCNDCHRKVHDWL